MRIIAHRGNLNGPNPKDENKYSYIETALGLGFDVEVDVWVVGGQILLGHDSPQYSAKRSYIADIGHSGWFHCKNLGALEYFKDNFSNLNYFWHQEDDFTLTSQGHIWTYPGKDITKDSIVVMPERSGYILSDNNVPYGICTDFCIELKNSLKAV